VGREPTQILKAVDACLVPIAPTWLQGVTADDIETDQLKAIFGIFDFRSQDIAEHIRFAAARCARASAAKKFKFEI
jgi:hypothetical protein